MTINRCCYYYCYFPFAPGSAYLSQMGEFDRLNDWPQFFTFLCTRTFPTAPSGVDCVSLGLDLGLTHMTGLDSGTRVHVRVYVCEWIGAQDLKGFPHSLLLALCHPGAGAAHAPASLLGQG